MDNSISYSFSTSENPMDIIKENFIIGFHRLAEEDFGLKDVISLKFAGKMKDIFEVHCPNKEHDTDIINYLETLIFNIYAYNNFKEMGVKRIVFIYEYEKEFEDLLLEDLRSMI